MAYWDHHMYSMTSLHQETATHPGHLPDLASPMVRFFGHFCFYLVLLIPTLTIVFTHFMRGVISAKTLALDPLVSLFLIFHVLCCLPPCDST